MSSMRGAVLASIALALTLLQPSVCVAVRLVVRGLILAAVPDDEHLAHPSTVGRFHRQCQPVDLDHIANLWDATDLVVDQAADGVVLLTVGAVELRAEVFSKVVHAGPAVDARPIL